MTSMEILWGTLKTLSKIMRDLSGDHLAWPEDQQVELLSCVYAFLSSNRQFGVAAVSLKITVVVRVTPCLTMRCAI